MTPIVDEAQAKYGDRVDFRKLNARDGGEGQRAFRAYALRGHPSYLLLQPGGHILWQGLGEITRATLEAQLDAATASGVPTEGYALPQGPPHGG
jgi:hypothetical protein